MRSMPENYQGKVYTYSGKKYGRFVHLDIPGTGGIKVFRGQVVVGAYYSRFFRQNLVTIYKGDKKTIKDEQLAGPVIEDETFGNTKSTLAKDIVKEVMESQRIQRRSIIGASGDRVAAAIEKPPRKFEAAEQDEDEEADEDSDENQESADSEVDEDEEEDDKDETEVEAEVEASSSKSGKSKLRMPGPAFEDQGKGLTPKKKKKRKN